eukprot:CAMPEP_0183332824 /NCGR_PEP_ID=MMETSP0164_2-20130417/1890_1 /TAXON_ID=221442 /ORGANISM="Coccolithus pelagicus ssp braarudi, Strain PLY182g" /LENGTH=161 /DNA_ID=CAMNT_0025501621 /DNA_START=39 /DNA_END=524 /DNA_ORIENTATION=+
MANRGQLQQQNTCRRCVALFICLLTAQPVASFAATGKASIARPTSARLKHLSQPACRAEQSPSSGNPLRNVWARYVLMRPDMDFKDLRHSTRLRTARSWSLEERTPGTIRTILITSALLVLAAIPVLLTNPLVLPWLLELAALSREGITPLEFYRQTGWFW